jgi:hypothetical protein
MSERLSMTIGRLLFGILAILMVMLPGCDKGLAPIDEPVGFSGVLTFKNWPSPDSVLELRIIAFEEFPADSGNIYQTLLEMRAAIYPHVTTGVAGALAMLGNKSADTVHYTFTKEGTILKETAYNYVVVAWRYGPNYFADWAPAGVYTLTPGTFDPATVFVRPHRMKKDVDITVDFHNLPPKPWR